MATASERPARGYALGQDLAKGIVLPILSPRLFEAVAADSRKIFLARGQRLYGPGDPRGVYLVQRGRVAIVAGPKAEAGIPWCTHGAGELCGAVSVFLGWQVDEARAMQPTAVTPLDTAAFLRLIEQSSGAALTVAQLLARHATEATARLAEIAVHPLTERLLLILRRLALEAPVRDGHGYQLPDWLTCEFLARMAGVTREAVSRARAALVAAGRIELRGRRMILLHSL